MGQIGLAEAIALLRDELAQAQDAGQGHQFRFEIAEAEVEFLVEVGSEGGVDGKVAFGVLSVGGQGKASHADSHRLRLKLKIKDAATGGRTLEVGRDEVGKWDE
jgi:hypothetical protein